MFPDTIDGPFPRSTNSSCLVFWHIHGGKICSVLSFTSTKERKNIYKVIKNSVLFLFPLLLLCFFFLVEAFADRGTSGQLRGAADLTDWLTGWQFWQPCCAAHALTAWGLLYMYGCVCGCARLLAFDYYDSICLLVWFVLLFQAAILDLYVCSCLFLLIVVYDRYSRIHDVSHHWGKIY